MPLSGNLVESSDIIGKFFLLVEHIVDEPGACGLGVGQVSETTQRPFVGAIIFNSHMLTVGKMKGKGERRVANSEQR